MNKRVIHKTMNKSISVVLATVLAFQIFAPITELFAIENNKIKNLETKGDLYNKNINDKTLKSKVIKVNAKENVIVKEPIVDANEISTYDESQEVKELRTENSKTFHLDNDNYVTEMYFEPIHKKEGESLVDIDNSLEEKQTLFKSESNIYENKNGLYDFTVNGGIAEIKTEQGDVIEITPSGNLSNYALKDNVILYSSVIENLDLEYRVQSNVLRQNLYINGKTDLNTYSFVVRANGLNINNNEKAIQFTKDDEIVFELLAPYLIDKDGKRNEEVTYVSKKQGDNSYEITLNFNNEWVNQSERVYPIVARTNYEVGTGENEIIDLKSSYIRSLSPTIQSKYADLFVGYDDQFYGGIGSYIGIARSFLHFSMPNIGVDQEVVSANLIVYKEQSMAGEWNEVAAYNSNYVDPYSVTWNTQPTQKQLISTQNVGNPLGDKSIDITKHVQELNAGQNKTLILQSTNESPDYLCNVFNSESTQSRPRIEIYHRDNYDVNPDLDINQFDNELRVYAKKNDTFEAISMDGIAKPDSEVNFNLYQKINETDFDFIKKFNAKGNSSRYFIDPIFISDPLKDVQQYDKRDVNYTTDYFRYGEIPKYDTLYEYRMTVTNNGKESDKVLYTDGFILYKVKLGDTLPIIAKNYGLKVEDIKKDNNRDISKIKEGDILFLRFAKDNPKVPVDAYRPPIKLSTYTAKYVYRGPTCFGNCSFGDPVNTSIGNFYHESKDFTLTDYDELFLSRVYNSYGDTTSGMFGNNFATNFEQFISYTKDDDMLLFRGDGKIINIPKKNGKYVPNDTDKIKLVANKENIEITDTRDNVTYIFDEYGILIQLRTKTGNTSDIIYDEHGTITSVNMGGKSISFSYNKNNLVDKITLPNGTSISYTYNELRQLTAFHDAIGNTESYTYDKFGKMASIVDKNGNEIAKNTYDKDGIVLSQIDGNGNNIQFGYDGKETSVTYDNGEQEVYHYNADYRVDKILKADGSVLSYKYNSAGNMTSETNEKGETTTFTYNDNQQMLSKTFADGTTVEYTYDDNGNVTSKKDVDGSVEYASYDANNNVVSKTSTKDEQSTFTYDGQGRLLSETNAHGITTTYEYEGNLISKETRSDGYSMSYVYDSMGNIVSKTDSNNRTTHFVYDNLNRVIKMSDPLGLSEEYQYDGNGNKILYIDKAGAKTTFIYDKNNNLISQQKGTEIITNQYDCKNRLISEANQFGVKAAYTYNELDQKVSETDLYGNTIHYTYDSVGHLLTTTDVKGNIESDVYENNNIVKHTDIFGNVTTNTYDEFHRLLTSTTSLGTITNEYDEKGNIVKVTDERGLVTTSEYDEFQRLTKEVSSLGVVKTYEYDAYGNVIKESIDDAVTTYTYDIYGNKLTQTDAYGNTTSSQYDALNRLIVETDALGGTVKHTYNAMDNEIETVDALGYSEKKIYDANQLLLQEIDKLGYAINYEYNDLGLLVKSTDANNIVSSFVYDAYGNITESYIGDKLLLATAYDKFGRKISETDTLEKTSFIYDSFDRIVEETNETTSLSKTISYDSFSNVLEESDNGGKTTVYEYDKFNQLIKTTDTYGRVEENTYDKYGRKTETVSFENELSKFKFDKYGNTISEKNMLGNETITTYDLLNRAITSKSPSGVITTTTYDALGRVIDTHDSFNDKSITTTYDAAGNVITTTDQAGNTTRSEYDAKGQKIKSIDALGNVTTTEYDINGKIVKTINNLGHTQQTQYNEFGLKTQEVDERGFTTNYKYNDKFQIIEIVDKLGSSIKFEYNQQGFVNKETNQNGYDTTFEYDIYGNKTKVIDPNGNVTENEYDKLGNIIEIKIPNKTTVNEYDSYGKLITTKENDKTVVKNTYNDLNQLVSEENALKQQTIYEYDNYGNILKKDDEGYITVNQYDAMQQVVEVIENDDKKTVNEYDVLGRLQKAVQNGQTITLNTYDAIGNITSKLMNGYEVRYKYDSLGRVSEEQYPNLDKENEFVTLYTYAYDESGNVTEKNDIYGNSTIKEYNANNVVISETDANGHSSKFKYDSLNNLVKVQDAKERVADYTYDGNNNMTKKIVYGKEATYKYDANNHLTHETNEYKQENSYQYDVDGNLLKHTLNDGTSITYSYDALGNKLSEGSRKITYDNHNNKKSVSYNGKTVEYTYDKFNQISSVKQANGNVVDYTWDIYGNKTSIRYNEYTIVSYTYSDKNRMTQITENDKVKAKYTYDSRGNTASMTRGNVTNTYVYDELNRKITDISKKDGTEISKYEYAYDGTTNVTSEIINGKKNTYTYDEMNELKTSSKYIKGKLVETTYDYDMYGNKIERTTNGEFKKYSYNDKNQLSQVHTKDGVTDLYYDKNGNVNMVLYAGGAEDSIVYDEFGQIKSISNTKNQVYSYEYDGEGDRIQYDKKASVEYDKENWYHMLETTPFEDVKEWLNDKNSDITFDALKEQSSYYHKNKNKVCVVFDPDNELPENDEDSLINYTLDKTLEFSEVLFTDDETNIYGNGERISTDDILYLNGLNKSVYGIIEQGSVKSISYEDFGKTKDIKTGYGYNGEILDESGFIYLRNRYYSPELSQFIQIDSYSGTTDEIVSQNRYTYALQNPYKYVDRGGNISFAEMTYGTQNPYSSTTSKKNTTSRVPQNSTAYPPHSYQGAMQLRQPPKIPVLPKKPNKSSAKKSNKNPNEKSDYIEFIISGIANIITKFIKENSPLVEEIVQPCTEQEKEIKQGINILCDELYARYESKFNDSGKMKEIKKVINNLRNEGLETMDIEYVQKICKQYEKKLTIPPFTSNNGVTYLTKSFVSLETSTISSAFVSDCSYGMNYSFTCNVNEVYGGSVGGQVILVKFTAGLPNFFDPDCFNYKISLCLDLVNVSGHWDILPFLIIELGGFIGIGGEIGFSWDFTTSSIEAVSKKGVFVGYWWKATLDIAKLMN